MDRKLFGPIVRQTILTRTDRLQKIWRDLNRAAARDRRLKKWIRDGFDNGLQQADMAEGWEAHLKEKGPAPLSAEEIRLQQLRIDHEKWVEEQKAKNKAS